MQLQWSMRKFRRYTVKKKKKSNLAISEFLKYKHFLEIQLNEFYISKTELNFVPNYL